MMLEKERKSGAEIPTASMADIAFLLLISFVLPYVPPKSFPTLSLFSLIVSPLILINILFFVYYAIRLKWKLIIMKIEHLPL